MARIVHINTVADTYTGVGSVIAALVSEQRLHGIGTSVAAGYARPGHGTFADYVMAGRTRHALAALEARIRANDGRVCRKATRRLTAWLDSLGDVAALHLHNLHGYYIDTPTLMAWAWKHKIRVVVSLHDQWWCTGRCAYIQEGCGDDCLYCRHRHAYPATWLPHGGGTASVRVRRRDFAKIMAATVARFAAPSQAIADVARERLGIPVTVIPNGIDTSIFNNSAAPGGDRHTGSRHEVRVAAVSATWTPAKGGDILRAVSQALPQGWHLTVVGDGAPVASSAQVSVTEAMAPQTLARLYRASDVLLNTATSEAFGMTVAEALACGTPVVTNAAAATSELVLGGINGYAVSMDASDPGAVIDAVRRAAAIKPPPIPDILTAPAMADAYAGLYFD